MNNRRFQFAVSAILYMVIMLASMMLIGHVLKLPRSTIIILAILNLIIITIAFAINAVLLLKERKKRLEYKTALTSNEKLFRAFMEKTNDVFWRTSSDMSTIIYVSPAFEEIWGLPIKDLLSNPNAWFNAIFPDDQPTVHDIFFRQIKENKSPYATEYRIRRPDGSIRYIYDRGYPIVDEIGNVTSILGIATDITQLKITNKRMAAQHQIAQIFESGQIFAQFAPTLLEIICTHFEWDLGEIWLISKIDNTLCRAHSWYKPSLKMIADLRHNATFKKGEAIPGRVWEQAKSLWETDFEQDINPEGIPFVSPVRFHCVVAVPILNNGNLIGVLDFFSQYIHKKDQNTLYLLEILGYQLGEYITRKKIEDQILRSARIDPTTGLLNRAGFEEKITTYLNTKPAFSAMILFDLDRFKQINEAIGFDAGDLLLQQVAERLSQFNTTNTQCRLASDQFAIVPNQVANINEAMHLAYRIINVLKEPFRVKDQEIHLTVSAGISLYPQDGTTMEQLLKYAYLSLVRAKNEGGNNLQFYTPDIPNILAEKLTLENELRQAFNSQQFMMYYQPKINLGTGAITGVEALIRWNHPTRGILLPDAFLHIAAESNLVIAMCEWSIREIFNQVKKQKFPVPVSINLMTEHFNKSYHLIHYIKKMINEFHIEPEHIEFEITESIFLADVEENRIILSELRDMGFKLTLDDFGVGYSSLTHLKNIAVDKAKIDRTFLIGVPENYDNITIIRTIIALFHSLGKTVIAEGVENYEQVHFLVNEGCDEIQGYYFSKPLPLNEITKLLKSGKMWEIPMSAEPVK